MKNKETTDVKIKEETFKDFDENCENRTFSFGELQKYYRWGEELPYPIIENQLNKYENQESRISDNVITFEVFDITPADLIGVKELSKRLKKSQSTIRRWVKNGTISCILIPNNKQYTWMFSYSKVLEELKLNTKRRS